MKKRILFVDASKYDEAVKLLTKAKIFCTSEYGVFRFDLLSFIIGGAAIGIVAILISVFN